MPKAEWKCVSVILRQLHVFYNLYYALLYSYGYVQTGLQDVFAHRRSIELTDSRIIALCKVMFPQSQIVIMSSGQLGRVVLQDYFRCLCSAQNTCFKVFHPKTLSNRFHNASVSCKGRHLLSFVRAYGEVTLALSALRRGYHKRAKFWHISSPTTSQHHLLYTNIRP